MGNKKTRHDCADANRRKDNGRPDGTKDAVRDDRAIRKAVSAAKAGTERGEQNETPVSNVAKELASLHGLDTESLKDVACFSVHPELRQEALKLLSGNPYALQYIFHNSAYADTEAGAKALMEKAADNAVKPGA